MTLYERANQILREQTLAWHRRVKSTGWETMTLQELDHLCIRNQEIMAALMAVEERLK